MRKIKVFSMFIIIYIFIVGFATCEDHTCNFLKTCSKAHCNVLVCSICGVHKANAPCGGDHNSAGYCEHCSLSYCTLCGHTCTHNTDGYCTAVHCTDRYYCTLCGHVCTGNHQYGTLRCSKSHCNDLICMIEGCNQHQSGICGGGCTEGAWVQEGEYHNRYCGRTDLGCTNIVNSHAIYWGPANEEHTSNCVKGCGLTYTHEASWSDYYTSEGKHCRSCMAEIGGSTCSAIDSHTPVWSEYVKSDNGDEASGASHLKRCTVSGCTEVGFEHTWPATTTWEPVNGEKHKRTCPTCELTQILSHDFVKVEAIEDNIEKHNKICKTCLDSEGNEYKILDSHIDAEHNGRGDGICDLCGKELWKVTKSVETATNQDITVKVEMFSDYTDTVKFPSYMIKDNGVTETQASGAYTISKNGTYRFIFEAPDREVEVEIDNISKSIYGEIFTTPDTATTGNIELNLITSAEGVDKTIWLKYSEDASWTETLSLIKEVTNNGIYVFDAKDSLGNTETFSVDIENIVSGFGTVTTTFDVFENGYIFIDILVNVKQEWVLADAIVNSIDCSIYKVDVDEEEKAVDSINKVQIIDEYGNRVTDSIITAGTYYIRVAIGGASIFPSSGTYMINLDSVRLNEGLIVLNGKNRIEVVVQSLNDLT